MADGPTTEIPADASEVVPDPDHALVAPGQLLLELDSFARLREVF